MKPISCASLFTIGVCLLQTREIMAAALSRTHLGKYHRPLTLYSQKGPYLSTLQPPVKRSQRLSHKPAMPQQLPSHQILLSLTLARGDDVNSTFFFFLPPKFSSQQRH
ncbi:hypothetical protein RRG08_010898 [Elysia crispata]|uniref:Secreted protein n=1 Tax=Elysia crispata TaxID=231223 RepID=A0AAE1A134_9GAST|nr:hypothetical protein RRG08_010898 [Elysia crispata]